MTRKQAELSIQESARTANLTSREAGQLIAFLRRLAKHETDEVLALKGLSKFMWQDTLRGLREQRPQGELSANPANL